MAVKHLRQIKHTIVENGMYIILSGNDAITSAQILKHVDLWKGGVTSVV